MFWRHICLPSVHKHQSLASRFRWTTERVFVRKVLHKKISWVVQKALCRHLPSWYMPIQRLGILQNFTPFRSAPLGLLFAVEGAWFHCKLDTRRISYKWIIQMVKRIVRSAAEEPGTSQRDSQDWQVAGIFVTEETMYCIISPPHLNSPPIIWSNYITVFHGLSKCWVGNF